MHTEKRVIIFSVKGVDGNIYLIPKPSLNIIDYKYINLGAHCDFYNTLVKIQSNAKLCGDINAAQSARSSQIKGLHSMAAIYEIKIIIYTKLLKECHPKVQAALKYYHQVVYEKGATMQILINRYTSFGPYTYLEKLP